MFDGGDIPQRQEGSRPGAVHFFLLMRCGLKFLTKYIREVHSHSLALWGLPALHIPCPNMASPLPESESHRKGSTLCGSEQSQAVSPARSDFRAPSAPSPSKHWPGHRPRLLSRERAKQTGLGRGGREAVCAFGSWKREKCADLGSKVGCRLSLVEPTRVGPFPQTVQAPDFSLFKRGPSSLTGPGGLRGRHRRRLAAPGRSLPSLNQEDPVESQCSGEHHLRHQGRGAVGVASLGTSGKCWGPWV